MPNRNSKCIKGKWTHLSDVDDLEIFTTARYCKHRQNDVSKIFTNWAVSTVTTNPYACTYDNTYTKFSIALTSSPVWIKFKCCKLSAKRSNMQSTKLQTNTAVGTGPADPAAAGPIIWQTRIFVFTLWRVRGHLYKGRSHRSGWSSFNRTTFRPIGDIFLFQSEDRNLRL